MIIKIAFYSNTSCLGGSEVYLKVLLEKIDQSLYEVLFFCPPKHPLCQWAIDQEHIEVVHVFEERKTISNIGSGSVNNSNNAEKSKNLKQIVKELIPKSFRLFFGTLKEINRLKLLFKQYSIDLIHFNDTGCEPPVIAARLAGILHVLGTYHVVPSDEDKHSTWVHKLIEYFSVRCMHSAISVSEATKQAWMKRAGINGENISVVHNGVDLGADKFCCDFDIDAYKREFELESDDLVVSVPARLHFMKGHKYLISAISKIIDRIPNIKFLFIGEGDLEVSLKALCEKEGVSNIVRFLGFRKDIINIVKLSDLIVLPSIALEALPFSLIEAHACSKAIVAANFGGIPEVVEDGQTGVLVPPKDVDALANAIIELLKDPEKRKRMGGAGRKRVEEMFILDKMLNKTFGLYEELLKTNAF